MAGSLRCCKSTMLIVKGIEVICQRIYDPAATIPVITLPDADTSKVLLTAGAGCDGNLLIVVVENPRAERGPFTTARTALFMFFRSGKGFASGVEWNLTDFLHSIIRLHLVTNSRCTIDLSNIRLLRSIINPPTGLKQKLFVLKVVL